MAIIKSGFLFGIYRSASGLTFYKRKGTSSVRSKPQRSLDWEPSDLQRFYQLVFSRINDFVKSSADMMRVIEGGWGWSRRRNSSSNLNNIIGYIFRSITRYEGGARRPQDESNLLFSEFNSNPLEYFLSRCQMTVSEYPILGSFFVESTSGTASQVIVDKNTVIRWRERVSKQQGRFRSDSKVFFLFGIAKRAGGGGPLFGIRPAVETATGYVFSIQTADVEGSVWQLALAINEDQDASFQATSGWAMSPVVASSVLYGGVQPSDGVSVTSVTLNGSVVTSSDTIPIAAGSILSFIGTNLQASKLFWLDAVPGETGFQALRLGALGTINTDTLSVVSVTMSNALEGVYVASIQDENGTVLYSFALP